MTETKFHYTVYHITHKKQSPYDGDWLFGRVQGHWDGQEAVIYALPSATSDEIALAIWHERAHAHFKHPNEFPSLETELIGEAKAWEWTYYHLPKKFRTKHAIRAFLKATKI